MTKFTVLVGVVFCAVFAARVAGCNSRYTNGEQFFGQQVGFGGGKCSALRDILPRPESGCCGKHASMTEMSNGLDLSDGFNLGLGYGRNPWYKGANSKEIAENPSDILPDKYITAGIGVGIGEFPWLVHLRIKSPEGYQPPYVWCGGSLISSRFVLTAAHCFIYNNIFYDDISVILAEYDTRTPAWYCVGTRCARKVIMHPDKVVIHSLFERNNLKNDIALMRLRGSAPYSEYIRPICLPPANIDSPDNQGIPLSISGWGQVGTNRPASPIKLKAQVELIPHQECSQHYPDLATGQVCAASRDGQDSCHGDSGGPLMGLVGGNFYVFGITSGKSRAPPSTCGSSVPTLYTNVFMYTNWIKYHMRD